MSLAVCEFSFKQPLSLSNQWVRFITCSESNFLSNNFSQYPASLLIFYLLNVRLYWIGTVGTSSCAIQWMVYECVLSHNRQPFVNLALVLKMSIIFFQITQDLNNWRLHVCTWFNPYFQCEEDGRGHQTIRTTAGVSMTRVNPSSLCDTWSPSIHSRQLTHLPLDKMAAISQTIFSDAFWWMESFVFWLKFHRSLFLNVQLTKAQHWFR